MQVLFWLSVLAGSAGSAFLIKGWGQWWIWPAAVALSFVGLCLLYWLFLAAVSLTVSRKKEYDRPSPFYYGLLNSGYRFLCAGARVRVHTTGLEKVPEGERFLLVSNHLSRFDPMVQSAALKNCRLAFISKPANFTIPIGRRMIHRCCYLPIDRENPRSAMKIIDRAAKLIRSGAVSVGVYPEGHRGKDLTLQDFRPGCFKIAAKAGCPILAATIRGTERIHKNFPLRRTEVYFDILDVLRPDSGRTAEISRQIHGEMQRHLDESRDEEAR